MQDYKCLNKCCVIKHKLYKSTLHKIYTYKHKKKAGIFIYDPKKKSILLIQSRGHLLGPPKGTLEKNETETECAIREVLEETGLDFSNNKLIKKIKIKTHSTYFYVEMDECKVQVQDIQHNDANSITWIKTSCLIEMIKNKQILLTQHCKILLKIFLNIIIDN